MAARPRRKATLSLTVRENLAQDRADSTVFKTPTPQIGRQRAIPMVDDSETREHAIDYLLERRTKAAQAVSVEVDIEKVNVPITVAAMTNTSIVYRTEMTTSGSLRWRLKEQRIASEM